MESTNDYHASYYDSPEKDSSRKLFLQLCTRIETNDSTLRRLGSTCGPFLIANVVRDGCVRNEIVSTLLCNALRDNTMLEYVVMDEILALELDETALSNLVYFLNNNRRLRRLNMSIPKDPTPRL